MSNPDFWLDWISWLGEVEMGAVLLASMLIFRSVRHFKKRSTEVSSDHIFYNSVSLKPTLADNSDIKSNVKSSARFVMFLKWLPSLNFDRKFAIFYLLFTIYFLGGWFFAWQKRDLWLPRKSIEETAEYRIASFLNENVKSDETVFLSGTTAFWLNSFYDIKQVRGGADQASLHSTWRDAAWELRQGASTQKAEIWLKKLGIDYIVVHTNKSSEFYHDFKNTEKFERSSILRKFYDQRGDLIYRVDDN